MSRSFLRERSICVECGIEYVPRECESQEQWIARMFCTYPCSLAFGRRKRYKKHNPPDVVLRMKEREKVVAKRLEALNNKPKDNASVRVRPSRAKTKEA